MPRAETTHLNVQSSFAPVGVGGLVRRGVILVAPQSGPVVTLEEANAALDAVREREV